MPTAHGTVRAMWNLRFVLAVVLVVSAVLLGTVTLSHAHDASAPGLYSSQCPLWEFAGQSVDKAPARVALAAPFDLTSFPLLLTPPGPVLDVARTPASPRAPPQN